MTDSLITLICPACGKEMKKIYVKDCDKVIDICLDGCGGIFFDNQELKFFDEENESIDDIETAIEGKVFQYVDTAETRICPVCNVPMVKNFTSATNEIEIDECYTCGGKFLDYCELYKIREEFSTEKNNVEHFVNKFNSDKDIRTVLNAQDLELKKLKQQRSFLKQFFDEFIWKI